MGHPRVILADDHAILREGLLSLLQAEFEVIGAVSDGRALVADTERLQPDVVILDIGMPLMNGVEAAAEVRRAAPRAKLVFLSQHSEKEYVQAAFRLGASAYVLKNTAAAELVIAVKESLAGRRYICNDLRRRFGEPEAASRRTAGEILGITLTPRQREVLQLIAEGKAAKEIAHVLGISAKTVEFHKYGIMDELGLRTTAELTRYAIEHRIVAG